MKRLLLFTLGTLCIFSSFAQSNREDIDMVQAIYGKEKKAIVADFIMPPDSAKKVAFWKLYDAYETERKALGRKRIALLEKYANAYNSLDDKMTDQITMETIALASSLELLMKTYYTKLKTAVGIKQAAQFYQIEGYLLSATRVYILGSMPFIDELEKLPSPAKAN